MEKIYVADIGTNSARLMEGKFENGDVISENKTVITVRTGEGMDDTGKIGVAAEDRICSALTEFKGIVGNQEIHCFATSAMREASNAAEVLDAILKRTGLTVRILSGREEAETGFVGVAGCGGTGGVIDIGGGSTEVIFGRKGHVDYAESFPIGCVRGKDRFTARPDREEVEKWAEAELRKANFAFADGLVQYGIGGSITTLAAIELGKYDRDRVHEHKLRMETVSEIAGMLYRFTVEERKKIPGLQPKRADIIPFGASVLEVFMRMCGLRFIVVSESDNLEGFVRKYCLTKKC